jgi:hypothetical protein
VKGKLPDVVFFSARLPECVQASAALCAEKHGPRASYKWQHEGHLCRSNIGADLSDCLTHRGESHTAAGGPQFGRSKSPSEKQIVTKERDLPNLKLELASIDGLKTLEGHDRKA